MIPNAMPVFSDEQTVLLVNDFAFPDNLVDKFGCVIAEIGFPAER
jgi:hypothetical protein